ncbi:very short patch repair endonuclease [Micromonospora orduensis]|uniref:very short patch repair endonuclease n=1 Tax=Micromonospora orduensis TaxID=1420891 RepID=UPI0033D4D4AA
MVSVGSPRPVLGSVYLRLPPKSRRVYAYLRWSAGGRTREKYICQVGSPNRLENLAEAWDRIRREAPTLLRESASWASSPAVRSVMRGNRSRDTRPELALRSAVHARGLRYRVGARPIPELRRTADLVFAGPKVAVFLDGCFWHGCPQHYRPSTRNGEFWLDKVSENRERDKATDLVLREAGWNVVRVWEHEDPKEAAQRVETAVLSTPKVIASR